MTRSLSHALVPSAETIYELGSRSQHLESLALNDSETRIVAAVDGDKDVVTIARDLQLTVFEASRALYCLAAVGVVVLTIDVGTLPWVSLALAGTFAVYGLIRKTSPVGSLDGLTLEMAVMAPFALVAVLVRGVMGAGTVGLSDPGLDLLLLITPHWEQRIFNQNIDSLPV